MSHSNATIREAEAARDRVRYETETLAARIASEAASVLDDALRQRRDEERARRAEIEAAGAALAALEAGVETVALTPTRCVEARLDPHQPARRKPRQPGLTRVARDRGPGDAFAAKDR